jgi:hypothetical protein
MVGGLELQLAGRKPVLIAAGVIVLGVLFAELDRGSQKPSETEFVAVGVNKVEEALTPFGVAGRSSWLAPRCERTVVKLI